MAHAIDMSNNRANMAYAGQLPWHGLGKQLTPDAGLDVWRKEAGMYWNVNKTPLQFKDDMLKVHDFQDRFVLYRSDNKAALGVVSSDYRIVHPGDVIEFFRDMIEGHGFQMETAGCLFGGRKFWALARTGKDQKILGEDVISPYLLMATSCDGSASTAVHPTSVRVVCSNTLRTAIGADGKKAKIRVPHSATFDPALVKSQLGLVGDAWDNFMKNITKLTKLKMDRDVAIQLVADELKAEWKKKDGEDMETAEMLDSSIVLRRIFALYDGEGLGSQYKSAKGTGWGLVNAVTQFFDHEAGNVNGDRSRSFERAHLTDRANFKVNIANKLLEMA